MGARAPSPRERRRQMGAGGFCEACEAISGPGRCCHHREIGTRAGIRGVPGRRPAGRISSHASPAGTGRDGLADQRRRNSPIRGTATHDDATLVLLSSSERAGDGISCPGCHLPLRRPGPGPPGGEPAAARPCNPPGQHSLQKSRTHVTSSWLGNRASSPVLVPHATLARSVSNDLPRRPGSPGQRRTIT